MGIIHQWLQLIYPVIIYLYIMGLIALVDIITYFVAYVETFYHRLRSNISAPATTSLCWHYNDIMVFQLHVLQSICLYEYLFKQDSLICKCYHLFPHMNNDSVTYWLDMWKIYRLLHNGINLIYKEYISLWLMNHACFCLCECGIVWLWH